MNNVIRLIVEQQKKNENKYSFMNVCNLISRSSGNKLTALKLIEILIKHNLVEYKYDRYIVDSNNEFFIFEDNLVSRNLYLSTLGLLLIKYLWSIEEKKSQLENLTLLYMPNTLTVNSINQSGELEVFNGVTFIE